jgi:hypothetical protein
MRNKKAISIGSGIVWVPSMFLIAIILFFHLLFTLGIFGETTITDTTDIRFEDSKLGYIERYGNVNLDLQSNREFLNFLNTHISVEGKSLRVIDAIRFSLDPYFEITNRNGKNYFEVFDQKDMGPPLGGLNSIYFQEIESKFSDRGFSRADANKFISTTSGFMNTETYRKITEEIDRFCPLDKFGRYSFELPHGIMIKQRTSLDYKPRQKSHIFGNRYGFSTVYKGEHFTLRFFVEGGCRG